MTDPKSANSDPSMDDILASIRRIISDDEARAQVNSQQGGRPAVPAPAGSRLDPRLQSPARDDVLLLTDLIADPKADGAVPSPISLPPIDRARAAEMPQPSVEPAARPAVGSSLVGDGAATSATAAFARLHQVVEDGVPPAAARDPGLVVGSAGKTVEDLVKEMLRPMLQEWLDRNLPQIVERSVEREIVRLTHR